jgi:PAS domain S-box-containing protein
MEIEEFVAQFEAHKASILHNWISKQEVASILDSYHIRKDYFIKTFAVEILNYYVDVVKKSKKIGDCPAVEELLEFLKYNNVKSGELFILCSGFKNALIDFMYDLKVESKELKQSINYIFEQNFQAVLEKFIHKDSDETINRLLNIVDKNVILSSTDIKGNIISVSQAFCEISGYSKEELIGKPHNIVRHSDMKSFVYEDLWETIQSGMTWRGEIKNRSKDGSAYWVYANIEPHYNKQGEIVGYDALRHDITAKKELEEQQAIIVEQSKSAAMGEMISMIAHQWRQPLQAVSILIQKLPLTKMVEGELSDEFIDKVVDDVGLQLDYMSKTIDDFRDFFKPEKLKQTIKVSELIHRSQEFLNYMFKVDSIEFSVESIEDVSLNLHINEVVQVLINIIKNARDAMLEKEIKNRKIIVRHYTKENFAIIEIQDNAGGIKNELKTKIFEPYFSTKQSKNGTGLGLYMSKKIIQQYCKGHIGVDNKNDGAVFTIKLPLDETIK